MQASVLLDKQSDGVATVTLNRPERLNAFNRDMIVRWHAALADAFADPAVRVLVITGAGRAFCAGGDVSQDLASMHEMDSLARKNYLWEHVHKIAMVMDRSDKPVIAAVNGPARGAGMDMALMCDMRIAAQSASFAESYINFGLIAGDAGTYFLPRLIGAARALELFWTGRTVDAQEADRIGLVNRVVPDGELLGAVNELARQIASQPSEAIRMYKRVVYQSATLPLMTHLDMVSSHMAVLEDTPAHKAKIESFLRDKAARAARAKGK